MENKINNFTDLITWQEAHKDVKYISLKLYDGLADQSISVHKLLNALIKSTKNLDSKL